MAESVCEFERHALLDRQPGKAERQPLAVGFRFVGGRHADGILVEGLVGDGPDFRPPKRIQRPTVGNADDPGGKL